MTATTLTATSAGALFGSAARRRLAASGALSVLAGGIHYLAAVEHLAESLAPALFLAAAGTAQIAAGVLLARRPSRAVVGSSVLGTLGLFALFSAAYSFGLPFGPHPNEPEHFSPVVAVSKLTELAFLWLVAPFLSWDEPAGTPARPRLAHATTLWAALAGVLLMAALALTLTTGTAHAAAARQTAPADPAQASAGVEIRLFEYRPQRLEVAPGTTVGWINRDLIEHSITSGVPGAPVAPSTSGTQGFDSGLLGQGATFSWQFNTPGEFAYFCTKHPSMRGTVWVGPLLDPLPAEPAPRTQQADQERNSSDDTVE
jgi:plastocyanin